MGNQKTIFNLIKQFAGRENIIAVAVPFIDFMGSIEGGIFLSQLIYWSDKGKDPHGWIYKTYSDWYNELRLSKYQVHKSIKICKQHGFLKTKIKKANGNPSLHYKVDMKKASSSLVKFLTFDSEKTSPSITEITNIDHKVINIKDERNQRRQELFNEVQATGYGITNIDGSKK